MEPDDLIIAVGDEIDKDRNALPNDLFGACKRLLESHGLLVVDPAKCMVLERRETGHVPYKRGQFLFLIGRWQIVDHEQYIPFAAEFYYPLPTEAR